MNEVLKQQLDTIKDLGQKIMVVEAELKGNLAKRDAIAQAAKGMDQLPNVKTLMQMALQELDGEIASEQNEIETLKQQLK